MNPMTPMSSPTESPELTGLSSARALERVRDELLAIDPRDLLPVNVDVAAAALTVIGAASEIVAHRAALVALCGEEMTSSVDRLELLARAALQAQATCRSIETGLEVQAISNELADFRDGLLAEVRALIARKVLPAGALRQLSPGNGFKNQCIDMLMLVSVLKDNWDIVEHETGVDMAYVNRAEAAANSLAKAVGVRNQASRSPAADLRQRAYTQMATTYDDVRRMIGYLRWKERDADRIAPSLYSGRTTRRTKGTPTSDFEPKPAVDPAPGMPGGSPFTGG
jgi:hypothetical protein